MTGKEKIKIFGTVFVAAFLTNIFISWIWDFWFHASPTRWDITSATAIAVAVVIVLRKRK